MELDTTRGSPVSELKGNLVKQNNGTWISGLDQGRTKAKNETEKELVCVTLDGIDENHARRG